MLIVLEKKKSVGPLFQIKKRLMFSFKRFCNCYFATAFAIIKFLDEGVCLQMNKSIVKLVAVAVVLLMLTAPAFGALNGFQAASAASKYQNVNEIAQAFGPYTYQGHPYFYIKFTTDGVHTGTIIIDGISGESSDIETARKIAFAHYVFGNITAENTAETARNITEYRQIIRELQEGQNEISRLAASPRLTAAERNELREIEVIFTNMTVSFTSFVAHMENALAIERDVLNGSRSYENAVKYMEVIGDLSETIDRVIEVLREAEALLEEDFGLIEIEIANDELKRFEQDMQRAVDWNIASMESRTQAASDSDLLIGLIIIGFMLIGIIAIIIGIVYAVVVLTRKKKQT